MNPDKKPNAIQRKLLERLTNSQTNIRGVLDKMNATLQQQMGPKGPGQGDGKGPGGDDEDGGGKPGGQGGDGKKDEGSKEEGK